MPETWPYDAAQHDPLTALRIAVVDSPYPDWFYLVSLCVDDDQDGPWPSLRPTVDEVAILVDELEFERAYYRQGYLDKMAARPFDIDGGFNSLTFAKRGEGDWTYRRRTWSHGPWPVRGEKTFDLPALLDHIHLYSDRWEQWKTAARGGVR